MARNIGTTSTLSNGIKTMSYGLKNGTIVERTAQRMGKSRNKNSVNLNKLLSKGHLVPIYEAREDTIFLIGYRRRESSRKSHQRPFMLKAGISLGKINSNPEPKPETKSSTPLSPKWPKRTHTKNHMQSQIIDQSI
jgi:hypothetical protein